MKLLTQFSIPNPSKADLAKKCRLPRTMVIAYVISASVGVGFDLAVRGWEKGEIMNKVIKEAKPIIEATLVTVVLVGTALAVPAAIIFTAI
jgi:hypothetical protein